MPNFEFSDTSSFRSNDTLSMKDFIRGGGKSVSGTWKIVCWVLIVIIVVETIGAFFWIRDLKSKITESEKTKNAVNNLKAHADKLTDISKVNSKDKLKKWIEEHNKEAPKSS